MADEKQLFEQFEKVSLVIQELAYIFSWTHQFNRGT